MSRKIFVNLPVKNLKQSIDFFTKLGFSFNPQFTDETTTCMIVSDDIFVMLLTHDRFKSFTPNAICDARKSTEVLVCLSSQSRTAVDEMVSNAIAAGGTTYNDPQDHGFMYAHGFQDLDGHIWEIVYMEPDAIQSDEHPTEQYADAQV
ncbi:MAG TPA: VOC family protein [Leptolyngbyaceae cyanobacterium M33_DOE_097]|uniref:Glyoxalase/bleomycin resistance/extradiol dioxygenase family protein n=1 Tax=Oscillatoriales cyanobacterium SpSt-418 TaxID=2282169 RepID=A0A7C3PBK1_9CYAN|nr:VOC family protein [Leptolyngbyaceae cyanobacterium M33_DOE_097]